MDPHELVPLEAATATARPRVTRQCTHLASRTCHRGPIRICRLLALLICLPSIFIFVPLYMRYRVFSGQMYPMSMSDMRLIDSRISTTWCQSQVVKSNTTFNAFVVPGQPELTGDLVPVTMTRQLELQDDMKEYWGFYLLKGSTVTVSTCVRWPGASLIMIKGYKHLQECAYIGDDSSEELDELLEANKRGLLSNDLLMQKIQELKKVDGKANDPGAMKRHKAGVSFHDPSHGVNNISSDNVPTVDVTDHDPKELRAILEHFHALRQKAKDEMLKHYKPPSHLMSLPGMHRHRDTNVDRDERKWLSFKDLENKSEQWDDGAAVLEKSHEEVTTTAKPRIKETTTERQLKVHPKLEVAAINSDKKIKSDVETRIVNVVSEEKDKSENSKSSKVNEAVKVNETVVNEEVKINKTKVNKLDVPIVELKEVETNYTSEIPETDEQSSKEVFEDVLMRLRALGPKGKRVLVKLHATMGVEYNEVSAESNENIMSAVKGSDEELDRLRKVLVEAIDEEKTRAQRQQRRRDAREEARVKRELMLGQIDLKKELNEDDEARDYAAEEGLQPDGYAEHHDLVNETTAFDMSNSEFWSSFSSSEEALLECEGLILNLPLTPHSTCHADASEDETTSAARANALTYRVPSNGYYFFVFNSENEVQTNFINARFDLQKTRYDVAKTALRECKNSTNRCDLSLDLFSSQKVVLEVPLRNNDSLWNEQFVIISECEPRKSLYLMCVIAVPILIMMFAFQ
ncbi:hypothetical protein ABMA28_010346 [Loxostege sticticalis]|uniref:E3 ubiquitin-protein ligase APD1-4 middle domain-containing protein n=1 Tax=Loxostege sticticalis TaxID=481309 RepID=A0ABD0SAJ2_LOXSC